jgi:hypothetical protein
MSGEKKPIQGEVEKEIGELISQLSTAGWAILASRYEPKVFGNWFVDVHRDGITVRLVKDRSQYFVDRLATKEIKASDQLGAFSNLQEFREAVIKWLSCGCT